VTGVFPFTAIVGQDELREALLACAVDPVIGGVLVRGERGTAKSTAVRALAPLMPDVDVVEGCAFAAAPGGEEAAACPDGPHPIAAPTSRRPVKLVELPVGATADRLVGSFDLEGALASGAHGFQPGLLAAAHRGILYVDEVNLLPDHLVDVMLDAAAMGRNHVERDGVSATHPARFLLVGTMNPEEGELRPQLLDRFGLSVQVAASDEVGVRAEVVRRRLAFDGDPSGFGERFDGEQRALAQQIASARERLESVRLPERALLLIAGTCARLGVDGMRADIVCARTACALAALDGDDEVTEDHIRRAAALALGHRRRRGPLEAPGLAPGELDNAMREADPGPDDDGPDTPPDSPGAPPDSRDAPSSSSDAPGNGSSSSGDRDSTPDRAGTRGERTVAPAAPTTPPLLALVGAGRGPAGRRSRSSGVDGHPIDARAAPGATGAEIATVATMRAATRRRAAAGGPPLTREDLHEHIRTGREGNLIVFCVDASGSMGARRRMASVKGAILGLLLDAYQRRDRIALVTFRGAGAELALPPTASVERAAALLTGLATGGGTPLAAGLGRAAKLVLTERRRAPERRSLVLVVTDGRASGGPAGRDAALRAGRTLAATADRVIVFDAEDGRVRLGLAGALAAHAGAQLLPLAALGSRERAAARNRETDELGLNVSPSSSLSRVRGTAA
jgi:magnesium chelatase subunit D